MFGVEPCSGEPACPVELSVSASLASLFLLASLPVRVWCDSGIWSGSAPVEIESGASLTSLGIVLGRAGDLSLLMLTRWGISFPVLRDTNFTK